MKVYIDMVRRDPAKDVVRLNPVRSCSHQVFKRHAGVCQHMGHDNIAAAGWDCG
jgi:hypothetical protein